MKIKKILKRLLQLHPKSVDLSLGRIKRKLKNLNVINQIEDFNLGWNATARMGSDFSQNEGSPTLIWQSQLSKGFDMFDEAYWLIGASFEGEIYSNSNLENRLLLNLFISLKKKRIGLT